jgi:hypothetical protein
MGSSGLPRVAPTNFGKLRPDLRRNSPSFEDL